MKRVRPAAMCLVAVCAVATAATFPVTGASAQDAPKTCPDFTAIGVHGLPATTHPMEVVGGRLVVLTFVATWSERCIEEVKHLNKLHDKYSGRGMTILAVAESDIATLSAWAEEHDAHFPFAALDTQTYESLAEITAVPGQPHSVLVDPDGTISWGGHPREVKKLPLTEKLVGIRVPPPRLPAALVEQEKLFAAGQWGTARASLVEVRESLDAVSKDWAAGLIEWVDERRGNWLSEAAALLADGRHWDAWAMYDDFPRRFEGLAGADEAVAAAAAIRADAAAKPDLEAGDLVQKGREKIAEGDNTRAALILNRVVRTYKTSPHAKVAKELLKSIK